MKKKKKKRKSFVNKYLVFLQALTNFFKLAFSVSKKKKMRNDE